MPIDVSPMLTFSVYEYLIIINGMHKWDNRTCTIYFAFVHVQSPQSSVSVGDSAAFY